MKVRIRWFFRQGRKTIFGVVTVVTLLSLLVLCFFICREEINEQARKMYQKALQKSTFFGRYQYDMKYQSKNLYYSILDKIGLHAYLKEAMREQEQNEKEVQLQQNPLELEELDEMPAEQRLLPVLYAYSGELNQSYSMKGKSVITMTPERAEESPEVVETLSFATLRDSGRLAKYYNSEVLYNSVYILDPAAGKPSDLLDTNSLLKRDLSLEKTNKPQILIYHTHGTEAYADSRPGESSDTVVGMGAYLCKMLEERGFSVIHDETTYDFVDGKDNRSYAYSTARPSIQKTLHENPSIQVILDIHRDSGAARVAEINGVRTARIMFFNGLSRNKTGIIEELPNPNLKDNLSFSLQMHLLGEAKYPGLMYRIYLKNYRYNMHLAGRYLLVELGTEKNTVSEAAKAIEYLAEILEGVLKKSQ